MKRNHRLLALLLALGLALCLAGCSKTTETVDKLTRAAKTDDSFALPEDMDATARFATETVDGDMYIVWNGIQKRDTGYFYAPSGALIFTASVTGESTGLKSCKFAVWKLVDGGTQYVPDTTIYIYTDGGTYTYTIDGLDPSAQYRLTLSYDTVTYYMYGTMRINGVSGAAPIDESASSEAAA